MASNLDLRKLVLASLALFIPFEKRQFLVQQVFLMPKFPGLFPAPPETQVLAIIQVRTFLPWAIFVLIFVLVFSRG